MSSVLQRRQIERNVRIHDRIATRYERAHVEIFNPVEQARLQQALVRAKEALPVDRPALSALDFGCGSGNLTRHLLALGFHVVSTDVSPRFLDIIRRRHAGEPVTTCRISGQDLARLEDGAYDIVAAYSVLHHVPDYLAAVQEMARVTRSGGVIYIDHEHSPAYWRNDPVYHEFLRRASRPNWHKFLVPRNYYGKLRRLLLDPKYPNEGDIHVWPDDHVDWTAIQELLTTHGFEVLFVEDYLVYSAHYRHVVYEAYRTRCSDKRVMALRKSTP